MKRKLIALLTIIILFGTSTTAQAEDKQEPMKCVDFSELSDLPYAETYSYEEVLADMAQNKLISKNEINTFQANNRKMSVSLQSTQEIRYSLFSMDSYTFSVSPGLGLITYNCALQPRFYVGLVYYNGSYTPDHIVSLEGAHIYTGGGDNCIFGGSIFYRLEAGNRFFYGINGNVYKTATITTTAGLKIGLGESSTANFGVSYTDTFLKNVSFSGNYYSAGLTP